MQNYITRDVEAEIEKWLNDREIILMRGTRQSGKTTLLMRIREKLLENGTDERNISFVTFEDDVERIKFEKNPKEYIAFRIRAGRTWFLLDEVQYVTDIGKKLKLLFDLFPDAKFIATGSSSFDLTTLGKFLVGRVVFIDVPPFSFTEFLRAVSPDYERKLNELRVNLHKSKVPNESVFLPDLNGFLTEYITYGAYPRVVLEQDRSKKKDLLKALFATYVEKDVVSLYGNRYRDSAIRLLKTLAAAVGGPIKYETLCQQSGLKYNEVKTLLPLMEDSFVIRIVPPFHGNLVTELRKNPKIYFIDCGTRNYLMENFETPDFGALYENFACNALSKYGRLRYWRTTGGAEMDFVLGDPGSIIGIEIKKAGRTSRSLTSFIENHKPKTVFIASKDEMSVREISGCMVFTVPLAYL